MKKYDMSSDPSAPSCSDGTSKTRVVGLRGMNVGRPDYKAFLGSLKRSISKYIEKGR